MKRQVSHWWWVSQVANSSLKGANITKPGRQKTALLFHPYRFVDYPPGLASLLTASISDRSRSGFSKTAV
jgi:hypothetical protein